MEIARSVIRRCTLVILFCIALFTSFQSVSGVQAQELTNWMTHKLTIFSQDGFHWVENNVKKHTALKFKSLKVLYTEQRVMSHEVIAAAAPSIEEVINFSNYPRNRVTATGYTAGIESTGKTEAHPAFGITYSGVKVRRDLYSTIAADPSVYPIGSILFIPGYGYGVVADTGSAIKGNVIDLYYETVSDVYEQWGKKEIDVYLVKKGNGKLTEQEISDLNENEAVQVFRKQF